MKLSIVIICWNDWKVIENCLTSIFEGTKDISYEVIVSDNASTDESAERIRARFPKVRVIENGANLGFARGNNVGIRVASGDFVLILNPDTVIHPGSLDRWVKFAEAHPEAGAFGCKVVYPDGRYQETARPLPTIKGSLFAALYLKPLAYLGENFLGTAYPGWHGETEREVGMQAGCCIMFRGRLLNKLGGFDERFFYHYEEADLCRRVWAQGYTVRFSPDVAITHLGGQSVGRFPTRFAIEICRNRYRYYYKHFGKTGARRSRTVLLIHLRVRQMGFGLLNLVRPNDALKRRLEMYRVSLRWNRLVDPVRFVEDGIEPPETQSALAQTT